MAKRLMLDTATLVSLLLTIIGAINWGLTVFGFDLVEWLGTNTVEGLATVIYSAVGVAGLFLLFTLYEKVM